MAVVENASNQDTAAATLTSIDQDQSKLRSTTDLSLHENDQGMYNKIVGTNGGGGKDELEDSFERDRRKLQELFSKLNPMAEEFVPHSLVNNGLNGGFHTNNITLQNNNYNVSRNGLVLILGFFWLITQKNQIIRVCVMVSPYIQCAKKIFGQWTQKLNSRTSIAQREEVICRTVYVSDIDHQVTEEQLAGLFVSCGQVVDCRICGDPNSVLRFAFIEFIDEEGAQAALNLAGTMLGFYPVKVLPSKTAIAPVNPTFLPRVTQADVKLFFEAVCGEVYRLRLLGDYQHSTRIAFVEFVMAESAIAALNCSGVFLGSLPIRVSPSKTPVRPRAPRLPSY
ncbi:hypothetical protein ES332_D11G019200v1 [Gossypium tomentosum]|uniref:RRM domain-containing protein n=1 Tax=Gossypium tomentosum TaxID=34277 RepID=A0A5D2IIK5_GOSTO|nr:hypothetical protein ES332_D11G019200v1 [Gossypium tomentosum]